MSDRYILDIATCPLLGAEDWLPDVKPHGALKDPAKIADDLAHKKAEQKASMALDLDLCRISAIGLINVTTWEHGPATVNLFETESSEKTYLAGLHRLLQDTDTITFNGLGFDLPVLERRMLYCGLPPIGWNLDRYRSPHVDLMSKLSGFGTRAFRPLSFYSKRLGWTDLTKPLTGAEEAQAPALGQWDALRASVAHDLEATRRLAIWMGIVKPSTVPVLA